MITDALETDVSLDNMIEIFVKLMPSEVKVVNLNETDIKGGCLGCLKCAVTNIRFYPDELMNIFEKAIVEADAVVYVYKVKYRYLSARMKTFQDRAFYNGHRPVFLEQQQACFKSGPLRQLSILRQIIETIS